MASLTQGAVLARVRGGEFIRDGVIGMGRFCSMAWGGENVYASVVDSIAAQSAIYVARRDGVGNKEWHANTSGDDE